jgi:phage shock protein A
VLSYLQQAESYYSQAQAALKNGNFAAYGSDLASMKAALDSATKAAQGAAPSPSAAPVPAPAPSPSP